PKTKAIVVVHIFGQSADMNPIVDIAHRYNLAIVEDACESLGAEYHGKKTGTFGQSSVFAFYPNKQMTTGEGGMVCTNEKTVYETCKSLTNQGRRGSMRWLDHEEIGYNYRLDEMSAALGVSQLKKLPWMIEKRREIASWYSDALAPYADLVSTPVTAPGNSHTWFVYVVRLKNGNRDAVIDTMQEKGIVTKAYLPSIHRSPAYQKRFSYPKGSFPISERVSDTSLALPFYIGLTRSDISFIVTPLIDAIHARV
ncbi:MAG: DegT/DnrJ/EryC1/StrS family aminotransferase, partial [Patescibacteria group bacterium]